MEPNSEGFAASPETNYLVKVLLLVSLFVLIWLALIYGVDVFLLVFAGILFGVLLRSSANWLASKLPVSQRVAVGIVTLVLVLVVVGAGWAMVPHLGKQISKLSETLPQSIQQLQQQLSQYGIGRKIVENAPKAEQAVTQNANMMQTISNTFRITIMVIGNAVAIFFLGLFFASSPDLYTRGVLALTPQRHVPRAKKVLAELYVTLSRWLQGQLMAMAVVATLTTLGLYLLQIELALVLGLLAGILAFIPNLGPVLSAIPAVLVALMDKPIQALYVVLLYIGVQTVESYMITPLIQKKMVRLAPALLLFSQFLMGITLGLFALALATPMIAALLVLVKMLYIEDVLGKKTKLPGEHPEDEEKV